MDSARCAIRREIEETGLFRLKHRSEAGNEAFSNLVGEEWEQHALERDFAKRPLTLPVGHMAEFLWLKRGDQAPVCQQTDKLGRLHIPSVAVTFSSDAQSIRLDGIGFNWDRDAKSPAYGYTDNNILKQIPDKGRSKAQPIVVDATSLAGAAGTEGDASIHVVDAEVEMVDAETDGVPVERFKVLKSIGDGYPACKEGWSLNSYTATPIQLRVGPKPGAGFKVQTQVITMMASGTSAYQAALWSIKVDKEDVHTGGFNAAALKA
ncbi:hypothetical protein WJX82_006757 [Trebouxia sp. C0006]